MKKAKNIEPKTSYQEILLFTDNSFSRREFCPMDEKDNSRKLSSVEELERACWEGMLFEMFPEILGGFTFRRENFIWHIMKGKNYLNISVGATPSITENETTIDPYFYMLGVNEN